MTGDGGLLARRRAGPGSKGEAVVSRPALGLGLAVAAALAIGSGVALSRLAWAGGTDALSLSAVRALLVVLLTGGIRVVRGRSLRLPRERWTDALGLGVLLALMFWGSIGAVQYLPVAPAVLLFFVCPPLVVLAVGLRSRRGLEGRRLAAALAAFAGLALALGIPSIPLHPVGVALAVGGGVAAAWNAVWIGARMQGVDPLVLTFHLAGVATVLLAALALAGAGLRPPATPEGRAAAVLVVALLVAGLPLYFAGIRHAGPELATMVIHLEPLTSILLAWLLYEEAMSPLQWAGAARVLASVAFMQRLEASRSGR